MRRTACVVALCLALFPAGLGNGSPVGGKRSLSHDIPEYSNFLLEETFRGGERACVIVKGDHKPVVDLKLVVYDQKDQVVVKDERGGDLVGVVWYPPRDAVYKIKIHNPGKEYNRCYISFK
jgi:hypothetical protein